MFKQIETIIDREEAFLPRFAPGTPQHSLLKNRIAALKTAHALLSGGIKPDRGELAFALPRIESILHKTKKARDKYEADSRTYRRLDPTVRLMEDVRLRILKAMEDAE